MPITYPIDFPTSFGVSGFTIGLDHAVAGEPSPFTFEEQIQVHQGVAWDIRFSIELLNREQAEDYNAFVLMLGGREGIFTMAVPGSENPRGAVSGTVRVNGANQTGRDLAVDGLPASTTGVFLKGDFIQMGTGENTKLHKVLQDVDSNASGEATLLLAPKINTAFADDVEVIYTNAKGVFRAKNNLSPVDIKPPNQHTLNFSAREAVK